MSGNGIEVLNKSVTQADYNTSPQSGVMHFMLPMMGGSSPDLPAFWSYARDWVLYSTIYRESMWAAAINIATTKMTSQSWEVESDFTARQERAKQLFIGFDGNRGWVGGMAKHLQAFLLTGNGGPVEIVRASRAAGSRILGLVPLDPFRTIRTGDPSYPLIYRDRLGREHVLRNTDAFIISDNPDMMDIWYGVGHCAGERAYQSIIKLEAIERYVYEKVSGKRALAFDLISGVVPQQIEDAKRTAISESVAKGVTNYMGSIIMPLAGDQAPVHVRINLAELPDGFERKEEFDLAVLTYARSIGIPVQDLQPLSGQGLGTGTQSQVLEESAKGQGLAAWRKSWTHAVNEFTLDDRTTFYFKENDIRDKEREAKVRIDESAVIQAWVTMGAITIDQARQLGVDADLLPAEFIATDETPGGSLSDTEKPVDVEEQEPEDTEVPSVEPVLENDSILKNARQIYQKIIGGVDTRTQALIPYAPQPVHSLSGMLDTAWNKIGEVDSVQGEVSELRAVLSDTQATQAEERERAESERALLNATLDALRVSGGDTQKMLGTLRASLEKESLASTGMLKALRGELEALGKRPDAPNAKQLQSIVVKTVGDMLALERVSYKHAEDLTTKTEVIEMDKNGLASKVRRTLADNSTQDFRVLRTGNGRIKALELIT